MRMYVLLALTVGVLLEADPPKDDGAKNEAEKLFRQMEAKLSKAKALDLSFDITIEGGKGAKLKGTLAALSGNKIRLEMSGGNFVTGEPLKFLTISDGTLMRTTVAGEPKPTDHDTPKNLTAEFLTWVARPGVFLPQAPLPDVKADDAKDRFRVRGFKLGNKEKVGELEAQRLGYRLSVKGQEDPFSVVIWLDLKTGLPVKRLVTSRTGGQQTTVVETYRRLTMDEKVDVKKFDLPR